MAVIYRGGIEIRKVNTGPYDNNCYVIVCPRTLESVIVDTPAEPEKVLAEAHGTKVKAVLMTHCHMDHVLGHREVKAATGAPVWVHKSEADQLPLPPEHLFQHEGSITFGDITLRTIHVPGHTTGGTSLLWGKHLFSGDTLFPNGPGRTQSPGELDQLIHSISTKLIPLPDATAVYPGHGDFTVLSKEKERLDQFLARPRDPGLYGDITWTLR